jgi:hypothetical protein
MGLSCATPAAAQLASQTALVGTVTDSSGAVLPGASVVAVNAGTRDTWETTTNAEAYYNVQFVRIGVYEITVTLSGFQTSKVSGVKVTTNQITRTNVAMKVGQLNESINVVASSPILDTDSARISETIGTRAVRDLPLNGRNVWSLANTTPGVLQAPNSDIGQSFRGAGQREIQNSLSLDGINSSSNLLAATSMRPIADAVTEVQVQTGSTSAEYGSYLGVHINVVTKSGTNKPHGSLFEFVQDETLDNRGYFENRANPKNPRHRDQFGAQIDGPMFFPKLYDGHNKTFFMGAYEGIRANALSAGFASVPSNLMRHGNFSEITTPIRNPLTGQPFPGNIIPAAQISPIARKLLEYYPAANLAGTTSNVQSNSESLDEIDQVLARVDQNIGNKIRLYGRYNWYDSYTRNLGIVTATGTAQPRVNKNTLFSYTHTLSANLFNDFRVGYHRLDFNTYNLFLESGASGVGAGLGIPGFDADVKYKMLPKGSSTKRAINAPRRSFGVATKTGRRCSASRSSMRYNPRREFAHHSLPV